MHVDDVCDVGELGVDDVGKHGDAKNVVELEMQGMQMKLCRYPLVNQQNYGTSACLLEKLTISIAMFNSYVELPEGINIDEHSN